MTAEFTRRALVASAAFAGLQGLRPFSLATAQAQPSAAPPAPSFGYGDVFARARELATAPFEPAAPLPRELAKLDLDVWQDIHFRPDQAFFSHSGGPFRLQLFHLGGPYTLPVTINTVHDGIATPIPYAANLFDYGRASFENPLPVNLGFAGFRLHFPLNESRVFDEAMAFLGASYYRFLGRGQRYGLSARGLTVNAGTTHEEFPFFREFWIETPAKDADHATIYALLDSPSVTGAYRFDLTPKTDSVLAVSATLFARQAGQKFGFAPLTSMFCSGEDDLRVRDDYRPELHDSDGLSMHTGAGEWIWRPLRNPAAMQVSQFLDHNVQGFGLLQRDRNFSHYEDINNPYQLMPNYWIEPQGPWGDGRVELVELPTENETNDNIVVSWVPNEPLEPGKPQAIGYRITASLDASGLSPNGRVVNTFQSEARAYGATDPLIPGTRRFLVDFAGDDLAYYLSDPSPVQAVASAVNGKILRSFLTPNPHIGGFRAGVDVLVASGESADLRLFLRAGPRALTETWTFPWKAD
ncbi:MAG TPA: glucan biosynthesis protein G [Beijerinckiaceae bacterium]|nr:glucan biosynthesis protein G [Beijerinckiaceae bacterium]